MQEEDIRLLKSSTLNLTKELDQMKSTMATLRHQSHEKEENIPQLHTHVANRENGRMPNSDDDVSSIEIVQAKISTSSDFTKGLDQNQPPQVQQPPVSVIAERQLEEARAAHNKEKEEMKLQINHLQSLLTQQKR